MIEQSYTQQDNLNLNNPQDKISNIGGNSKIISLIKAIIAGIIGAIVSTLLGFFLLWIVGYLERGRQGVDSSAWVELVFVASVTLFPVVGFIVGTFTQSRKITR